MWKCKCGNECNIDANFCASCGSARPQCDSSILWYYILDGERKGPVKLDSVIKLISSGTIMSDTLVWHKGLSTWKPAESTELSQFLLNTPPPVKSQQISNKWAWALATVPICVNILLSCLGMTEPILSICIVVLNSIFTGIDISYLKRSGVRAGGWLYLGFFLIPIYLFIRASKTNKRYGYAIVWCNLFILSLLPIW